MLKAILAMVIMVMLITSCCLAANQEIWGAISLYALSAVLMVVMINLEEPKAPLRGATKL